MRVEGWRREGSRVNLLAQGGEGGRGEREGSRVNLLSQGGRREMRRVEGLGFRVGG